MGSPWSSDRVPRAAALVLLARLVLAPPLAAQRVLEVGLQGMVTAADPAVVLAGGVAGLRTSLRTRCSIGALAGVSGGEAAWRGEALVHFLLNPTRRRGPALYGAGGVAVAGGPVDQGYVVVTLGLEQRPGARQGWFAEAGVGGGARLALGYRWRRFPAGWIAQ